MKIIVPIILLNLITLYFAKSDTIAPTGYKKVFSEKFQEEPLGELSDNFLILDGKFKIVAEAKGNKCAELSAEPLGDHGFLFGDYLESNIRVRCKILARKKRRSYPSFGVGIHGIGGYQFRVSPAKRKVEILFEEEVVASNDYRWMSANKWASLEITLYQNNDDDTWKIEGFIWESSKERPKKPIISLTTKEEPFGGESSVFGTAYSGLPILFDDLQIYSLKE